MPEEENEITTEQKLEFSGGVIYKFLFYILRQLGPLCVKLNDIQNFPEKAEIKMRVEGDKVVMFVPKKRDRKLILTPTRKLLKTN